MEVQLYDASERTIKIKTKIGEFILDGKLENKTDISNEDSYDEHEIDRNIDTELGRKKLAPNIVKKLREIEKSTEELLGYSNDVNLNYFYNNVLQDLIEEGNKIIIFTRYIDTADYLADELNSFNVKGIKEFYIEI